MFASLLILKQKCQTFTSSPYFSHKNAIIIISKLLSIRISIDEFGSNLDVGLGRGDGEPDDVLPLQGGRNAVHLA